MIHTFELSKVISQDVYDELTNNLTGIYHNKRIWLTTGYEEQGISIIRLYKFKPKRKNKQGQKVELANEPYRYMIALSINVGVMFGRDGYLANDILTFTPDFCKAIYNRIYELIPWLEFNTPYKALGISELNATGHSANMDRHYEYNAFKLRRIDFTFDIQTMADQYMTLIERGYCIRRQSYERCYFEDDELLEEIEDDESDIEDMEDDELEEYTSDTSYIYYKSKSLNINIYNKGQQLKRDKLIHGNNTSYDYLRIEVQVKKSKLNAIKIKFDLKGRELQYIATPVVEEYVLKSYVKALTGTGIYVSYNKALDIIGSSKFTTPKKDRLKKLIKAISDKHGIANVLEQIEDGTITDLGKLVTVQNYLREIHSMGINPVTLSFRMNVPKTELTNVADGTDTMKEQVLLGLVDVLNAYGSQTQDYQQNGRPITDEDYKQISQL